MFKGSIYVATDLNLVRNMMNNYKVIIIGEHDEALVQNTNGIIGTILVPPYPAMMANLDGNIQEFVRIYRTYLIEKEPTLFISMMLRAMMNGTNILLYLNNDEYNMYFGTLMRHIAENYGVIIGTHNNEFSFNPAYNWVVYSLLYGNELLTIKEYFELYPQGIQFPDSIISKLSSELNPTIEDTSLFGYRKYFFELKEEIKRNNNRYLFNPIRRVKR